jgi:hypothetical protein
MITVGKLAERFGLSRTTLLYYERIRLLRSTNRSQSGYRLYGEDAVARLRLISTYKSAGLLPTSASSSAPCWASSHSFLRWLGISEEEALAIRAAVSGPPPAASRRRRRVRTRPSAKGVS